MKIYHYTTFKSFSAIIKEDSFILSSFCNANDYKEKKVKFFSGESIDNYKYLSACYGLNKDGMDILSFENSMMWYYYAERNHGVCLELDLDKIKIDLREKIITDGYIAYNDGVTRIDNQNILEYLLEKRTCWIGEKEYRLIFPANMERIKRISSYITSVFYGCELFDKNNNLKVNLQKLPEGIQEYKMFIDKTDGRLNKIAYNKFICK